MKKFLFVVFIAIIFSCKKPDVVCWECLTEIEINAPITGADTTYHKYLTKTMIKCGISDFFIFDYENTNTHTITVMNTGIPVTIMISPSEVFVIQVAYINAVYLKINTTTKCKQINEK
jgi:hypothetical protein